MKKLIFSFISVVLLLVLSTLAYSQGYEFVLKWGSWGYGDYNFNEAWCVDVDSDGNVYIGDLRPSQIKKYDSDGNFITKWGIPEYSVYNLVVDSDGNIYVSSRWTHQILKLDSNGIFITEWGSTGSGDGEFDQPQGIDVDSDGNVYVADAINNRIQKFNSVDGINYTYVTEWGGYGTGDGQFYHSPCLAVDSEGNVYVTDTFNYRIQKFAIPYIAVTIDIKPGSYPNSINLGSNGNVPVAIFSTEDFDATTVNPLTITLAGAEVRIRGKGDSSRFYQDINGDGLLDVLVHVDTRTFVLTSNTDAILEGETFDGKKIRGMDSISIVN